MGTRSGIDQVIEVLKNMLIDFNTQSTDDEDTDRNSFIQEQEGVVMSSTAALNANKQQVQTLTAQIADLTSEIAETTASLEELIHLRQEEHKAHEEEVADLTHTIDAVNKATEVLEGPYAANGASMSEIKEQVTKALSALALSRASDPKMQPVTALLQNPDWLNVDGGAAYGEYKGVAAESGGVIGTLKTIRSTLMDQKPASIEKENESRRQFEVAKGAKEDELKKSKDEKASKENTLEECKAKIEHFTSVIAQAEVDIKDAKEYVAKLLSDRALFSKEYDGRVTMRNSEQAATQAALDALQEVTAGAKSGVEGAFLQTVHKMSHRVPCPHCAAAVQKLFKVASDTKNAALVQLGSAIESNLKGISKQPQAYFDASAMDPVKNLLHEMIVKLEDELAAETSHHEWCETEKSTSAAAKLERETNIESLTAEIEALNTAIAQLTAEIAFLHSELIRIQRETDAAIQLRKTEHKKQSPFAEYSSGSGAGASAMEMLQDLLNRYNEARTELIQSEQAAQKAHEDLLAKNEQFRKDTTQTKQAKETEKRQKNE